MITELTGITIDNQLQPVVTTNHSRAGNRSRTLKEVVPGAAAGGIIAGGEGAGKGAAVGAGAAVLAQGKQIHIPQESPKGFCTTRPLTVGQ